jgi:hypothetical protein
LIINPSGKSTTHHLASVARDAFLPHRDADARARVLAAVEFLLASNL